MDGKYLIKKWGIVVKAFGISGFLLLFRFIIEEAHLDFLSVTTLITAFIGGAIFTIAVIFSGTLSDFKESEKIPGDLAASLLSLHLDAEVIPLDQSHLPGQLQSHVRSLCAEINRSFRAYSWDSTALYAALEGINRDIGELARVNVAPPIVVKLRSELTAVDRLIQRIRSIRETSFIPAAYAIAELATGSVICILFIVNLDPYYEGLIIFLALSWMLIALLLLIRDMDNPFELGEGCHADVDLAILFELESHLLSRAGEPPTRACDQTVAYHSPPR